MRAMRARMMQSVGFILEQSKKQYKKGARANQGEELEEKRGMDITSIRYELAKRGITEPGVEEIMSILPPHWQEWGSVESFREIQRGLTGLGFCALFLEDPSVTDLLINDDGRVWVDRGYGMEECDYPPLSPTELRTLALQLAASVGVRLDEAQPHADGIMRQLPPPMSSHAGALRFHAILAPPAVEGACISIRVLSPQRCDLLFLEQMQCFPPEIGEFLRSMVREKKNFLISGGTGTGKTTLLSALLGEVSPEERIIIAEDTAEIFSSHPHTVSLSTRNANADGAGSLGLGELVRQALRMRPDRLLIGEVRGGELGDLLMALNTGHEGSGSTIHANSVHAVPGRLMALGALGNIPAATVRRYVLDGIHILIHLERTPEGRRISSIASLEEEKKSQEIQVKLLWERREYSTHNDHEELLCRQ